MKTQQATAILSFHDLHDVFRCPSYSVALRKALMRQYNVKSPFERIAIDVAGPFPESVNGNKYTVVVMDYFSKQTEACLLPNQEATIIAEALVSEWISSFGVPLELYQDQGRNFESQIFQNVCRLMGIRKTRTAQSDGMVQQDHQ